MRNKPFRHSSIALIRGELTACVGNIYACIYIYVFILNSYSRMHVTSFKRIKLEVFVKDWLCKLDMHSSL